MIFIRFIFLVGFRGVSFGVECLFGGDELVSEEVVIEVVMEVFGWIFVKFRFFRFILVILFLIFLVRNFVDFFFF